jgi:Putative DNA-binding domain
VAYSPIRSLDDLRARLQVGVFTENDWLEFKGPVPYPGKSDREDRAECACDVAQFTNAYGGSLIIGADEQERVFQGFAPVKYPEQLRTWISDVVTGQLRPVPAFDLQLISVDATTTCLVVNVDPHPTLVARYSEKRYQFVLRAGTSKRYLEMGEIEARMQGTERLMRYRLEKIPKHASIGLDANIREIGHNDWEIRTVDDDVVRFGKIGAPDIEAIVPLAYVGAVYPAREARADWVVQLSCYIAKNRTTGRIHVTKNNPGAGTFENRGLD